MAATDTQPLPNMLDLADLAPRLAPGRLAPGRARVLDRLDALDRAAVRWMQVNGPACLRASLALVFCWFGALKVIGVSPAAGLVERTVWWWDAVWFVPVLGIAECIIGLCFLVPRLNRLALVLMAGQMIGTFTPFLWLPDETFRTTILVPTMEGQYILKNVVLIAAAIAVGSHVRED